MKHESLLDVFSPPPGLVGQVMFLMAMSATRPFLERAVRRFTGLGPDRRAEQGLPVAYVALDAHPTELRTSALSPMDVPGLLELQPGEAARRGLLHAKLAIMAFGRSQIGSPTVIRVVVPTGNWTNTSARHLLELFWRCDVTVGSGGDPADRADVAAAARFARAVLERYDVPKPMKGQPRFAERLHDLLEACTALSNRRPSRFIHSLDRGLFHWIEKRVAGRRGLNVLLCGAGSFEQRGKASRKPGKPRVLAELEGLLGGPESATLRVTLEPGEAGAVDAWAPYAEEHGWDIVEPHDPHLKQRRGLHAKFVFVGHTNRGKVRRGLTYLGSGNLSLRGLMRGRPQGGNIECGVLLELPTPVPFKVLEKALYLSERRVTKDTEVTEARLPKEPPDLGAIIETPSLRGATLEEANGKLLIKLHWREDAKPGDRATVTLANGAIFSSGPADASIALPDGWRPAAIQVHTAGRPEALARPGGGWRGARLCAPSEGEVLHRRARTAARVPYATRRCRY